MVVETDESLVVHPLKDPLPLPPQFGGQPQVGATRNLRSGVLFNHPPQSSLKFTFSRIFNEKTSQKDFFDLAVQDTIKEFIDGQNALVFAYGVTNSGKTYTMQGTPSDGGVVPRTFDVIFNSIVDRQYKEGDLRPKCYCDVEKLDEEEVAREKVNKEVILRQTSGTNQQQLSTCTDDLTMNDDEVSTVVANRRREEGTVAVAASRHVMYSVWASFAEIYNEQVFDLLRERVCKLRRICRAGHTSMARLREVNVMSADEAFKLLALGQRNLQMAYTRINETSSRSHCIFTLKLIKTNKHWTNNKQTNLTSLSLCDLAGIERSYKTQNVGDRIKESGNINNSLFVLGRCIQAIRKNQSSTGPGFILPPFRDSKLTRLFQPYLNGRGRAKMIVTVSQCRSMYSENINAIKFSAVAKQVWETCVYVCWRKREMRDKLIIYFRIFAFLTADHAAPDH
ncbi:hypothetical protein HELRODRAFT_84358 [Helobdella robusta]|uniref:Kinesin motor domain-containing protein n=1 Tax=Helobdella robusta TaxID=6412 RepID=T1G5I0_HELRO|nr:hypothetical protein HELRODRAFT_84358 [Helobdella robusta]ESN98441.1 hypothetical protein HELRODRAFT_84358 [Helobdella robusta]